jgi:hypothetical protein
VLASLLPGIRQLRTPVACGYLWTVGIYLLLVDWRPALVERPPTDGSPATLWKLAEALDKATLIGIWTFIAYLVGSSLSMPADSRLGRALSMRIINPLLGYNYSLAIRKNPLSSREPFETFADYLYYELARHTALGEAVKLSDEEERQIAGFFEKHGIAAKQLTAMFQGYNESEWIASTLISREARHDLRQVLETNDRWRRMHEDWRNEMTWVPGEYYFRLLMEWTPLEGIIDEIPQLATRLIVVNRDLFEKYDRNMAEADLRFNIAPAIAFFSTATMLTGDFSIAWACAGTAVVLISCLLLLRQGLTRAVAARDAVVQALAIGVITSRWPAMFQRPANDPTDGPNDRDGK